MLHSDSPLHQLFHFLPFTSWTNNLNKWFLECLWMNSAAHLWQKGEWGRWLLLLVMNFDKFNVRNASILSLFPVSLCYLIKTWTYISFASRISHPGKMNLPYVAVIDVEGQANNAEQNTKAGKDGHGCKQLLRQEPVLLNNYCPICWRPRPWTEMKSRSRLNILFYTSLKLVLFHDQIFILGRKRTAEVAFFRQIDPE